MSFYYVDPVLGKDTNDGSSCDTPRQSYEKLALLPGDTVLFKRGMLYRGALKMIGGADNAPITYGAYGEGEMPTFCGSVDLSDESCWESTERENVWRCTVDIPTDVGNFIFNDNECTAALRWEKEALSLQGDFYDSRFGECCENHHRPISPQELLLYSAGNPATVYSHIEAATYGERWLGKMQSNVTIEGLRFINGGVHGLVASGNTKNVVIRNCRFENIGGCGWSRKEHIRFGNAIEFWIGAENVLIEGNCFLNIYDSCATHQGLDHQTPPAKNFHVRNNLFDTYSMAAFEYRAQMMIDSSFTGNVCKNAGCGFGMLGESLPRRSEIWPQPMGHHIFLWRIWSAPDGGSLLIADNQFVDAPNGAAVYSIICPEAEAQVTFRSNRYEGRYLMKAYFGGKETELT
jgi:hypothetical protein